MLRRGTRVTRLTQRVGQRAPIGKIVDVRSAEHKYEIQWEDGHTSVTTATGIVPVKEPTKR